MFSRLAYVFGLSAFLIGIGQTSIHLIPWLQSVAPEFDIQVFANNLLTQTPIGIPGGVYQGLSVAMVGVALGTLAEMHRKISEQY